MLRRSAVLRITVARYVLGRADPEEELLNLRDPQSVTSSRECCAFQVADFKSGKWKNFGLSKSQAVKDLAEGTPWHRVKGLSYIHMRFSNSSSGTLSKHARR